MGTLSVVVIVGSEDSCLCDGDSSVYVLRGGGGGLRGGGNHIKGMTCSPLAMGC